MSDPFIFATPTTSKVTCRVCGRAGWGRTNPTLREAAPWQQSCLMGHPFPCICGKRFATPSAIAAHVRKAQGTHARQEPTND